ncbi:MAG: DUF4145 domain-containing protein [Candidatus Daviesbacteria bacterium]|nr:DUF4145 domain-containing protein [Candidatus Daviesbacteria bacterium]
MNIKIPYKAPKFQETSFNCPFCNAYSNQNWKVIHYVSGGFNSLDDTWICFCAHCNRYSIWHEEVMIYPDFQGIEPPNDDLNEDIKADYMEASSILQKSPRGAAALLRLAIQKLCKQLGEPGQNINTDIGNLVTKGLPAKVQQSLDALRVIGNEAVHPGQLDLKDDVETATALFRLVNFIAEKMISEPKEVEALYEKIPDEKKKQIEERDGK